MKRENILKYYSTDKPNVAIKVSVYYDIGYHGTQRGLYLSVRPLERSGDFIVYTAYSGLKAIVKPLVRFSQSELENYKPNPELVDQMIEKVKQGLVSS